MSPAAHKVAREFHRRRKATTEADVDWVATQLWKSGNRRDDYEVTFDRDKALVRIEMTGGMLTKKTLSTLRERFEIRKMSLEQSAPVCVGLAKRV